MDRLELTFDPIRMDSNGNKKDEIMLNNIQNGGHAAEGCKEILYDGYYYDVTHFIKRHPGGSIIEYYCDKAEDATQAIQQFHQRSIKKINLMLKGFKRRPANDRQGKSFFLSSKWQRHR